MNASFASRATGAVVDAMRADDPHRWVIVARELLDEHENAALVADTLATWLRDQFGGVAARPVLPSPYSALLGVALDQVRWNTIAWRLVREAEAQSEQTGCDERSRLLSGQQSDHGSDGRRACPDEPRSER